MVMSWMAAAVALGLGGALVLGGLTAGAWDDAWPQGGAPLGIKGWQAAFLVAAIPGLLLGILLMRLPEPQRGAADGHAPHRDPAPFLAAWRTLYAILPLGCWFNLASRRASALTWAINLTGLAAIIAIGRGLTAWTNALRPDAPPLHLAGFTIGGNALQWIITGFGCYVLLNWLQSLRLTDKPAFALIARSPAMLLVLAIGALQSVINYGVMGFTPSYLIQHFHESPARVGVIFGTVAALIGIVGPLIAGPLSDRVHARFPGGRLYVTLASLTISPFLGFLTYRADTITGFYLWFVTYSITLTMWLPPIYATYLDLVLPRMRGTVISVYILSMTIIGLGCGPYAVGLMSDLNGGDLSTAILSLYWIGPLIVVLIVAAIRRLPKDEGLLVGRASQAGESFA
jgi:MFS family permease